MAKPTTSTVRHTIIPSFIQWGLIVLVALMPFHAFLTVWLGTIIGHRALIQSWKEALLSLLIALTVWLAWREPGRLRRLKRPVALTMAGFILLGLLASLIFHPEPLAVIFGLKIDDEGLIAALIAILVATPQFVRRLVIVALVSGLAVVAFGLLQIYVWPPDLLRNIGYGPNTVQPYLLLDQTTGSLRFPGTLGGPNQLGTYLVLVIALILALGWSRRRWWLLLALVPATLVLVHTYSRAAWIGALIAVLVICIRHVLRGSRRLKLIAVASGCIILLAGTIWITHHTESLRHYILHDAGQAQSEHTSDSEHADSLRQGLNAVIHTPLGHGLGTAGPATFQTGTGPIIEDYYLQIGYELGWPGLALWLALIILIACQLWRLASPAASSLLAALIGISMSALFLPVWTDSTLMLVCWVVAGGILSTTKQEETHVATNELS